MWIEYYNSQCKFQKKTAKIPWRLKTIDKQFALHMCFICYVLTSVSMVLILNINNWKLTDSTNTRAHTCSVFTAQHAFYIYPKSHD